MTRGFQELDTVVLLHDLPEAGLRSGDLGAVVQVYGDEAVEVEFVTAAGRTQALLTLPVGDVRPVRDNDLMAVPRSVASLPERDWKILRVLHRVALERYRTRVVDESRTILDDEARVKSSRTARWPAAGSTRRSDRRG
jgi:hypothetical protein